MAHRFYIIPLLFTLFSSYATANEPPQLSLQQSYQAKVGEVFSLNVAPSDLSGMVPSVYLDNPPTGSTFNDKGDGTRTFQWTPPPFGSTEQVLNFVLIDPIDSMLRTTVSTTLNIQSESVEPLDSLGIDFDLATNSTIPLGTPVRFIVTPRSNDGVVPNLRLVTQIANTEFVDNFNGSRTFIWNSPAEGQYTVEFLVTHPDTPFLRHVDSVNFTIAANGRVNSEVNVPVFSPINYLREISADSILSFDVGASSASGVPWLSLQSAPAHSSFYDNGDGTREFFWSPSERDIGVHNITFVARNPVDPKVSDTTTIQVVVVPSISDQMAEIDPIESFYSVSTNSQVVLPLRASFPNGDIAPFTLQRFNRRGATLVATGDGTAEFIWNTPSTPGEYYFRVSAGYQNGTGLASYVDINIIVVSDCPEDHVPFILFSSCIAVDNRGLIISDNLADTAGLAFNDIEVLGAGDFNGDGIEDWFLPLSDFVSDDLRVKLVLGTQGGITSNINLSELTVDTTVSFSGSSRIDKITALGDINADGYDDVAFSARSNHRIMFGRPTAMGDQYSVANLSGDIGFNIGKDLTFSSNPIIEGIGDFNGDGIDDFAIAYDRHIEEINSHRNDVYIFYGSSSLAGEMEFEDIRSDSGRVYTDFDDFPQTPVLQKLGDIDNDGFADIAVSQRSSDESMSHVIYGQPASQNYLTSARVPNDYFSVIRELGIQYHSKARFYLSAGGDINGDGYADVAAVGLFKHPDFDSEETTHAMVMYGSANRFSPLVNLLEYGRNDASERLTIIKRATRYSSLESFDLGGDMNGDGIGDIAIALSDADNVQTQAGIVYVLYGREFEKLVYLDDTAPGNGRVFAGSVNHQNLGDPTQFLGDINSDGFDDLLIGSSISWPSRESLIGFGGRQ